VLGGHPHVRDEAEPRRTIIDRTVDPLGGCIHVSEARFSVAVTLALPERTRFGGEGQVAAVVGGRRVGGT
jgi:hypothetical protein